MKQEHQAAARIDSRYFLGRVEPRQRYRKRNSGWRKPPALRILKSMPWTRIAALSEVSPGEVIETLHEGEPYAVCNVSGEIRVLSGVCPHAGGPLGNGAIDGGTITCPFHGWEFDSATGVCLMNDSVTVPTYPVRLEENQILADLPETGQGRA